MNDCKEVKQISMYIREWITKQPAVKEESLTDYLLFQISEKIPSIKYKAFSRQEESSSTGADWEWWFVFSNYAYKLRVQAKKTKPKDNYSSIAYCPKNKELQIEKLLKDAINTNSIPFYAFYSNENGKVLCQKGINDEGVYIAGANTLYNSFVKTRQRVSAQDILSITNPLSCFFCCPLAIKHNGHRLSSFFENYYREENQEAIRKNIDSEDKFLSNDNQVLGFHKSIPNYVSILIDKERKNVDEWYEGEFKNYIKEIDAIIVYDLRNKDY